MTASALLLPLSLWAGSRRMSRIITRYGDILSLIDDWAGFDAAVCIDAAAPMGAPGRIHRIDPAYGELPLDLSLTSSHAIRHCRSHRALPVRFNSHRETLSSTLSKAAVSMAAHR